MGRLGLGFTNPVRTREYWDVCLGCGGVGGEWVGGLDKGTWTCTSEAHPVFNPGYLMDIGFQICICLWQISQIQTRLCDVVRSGFVSTSPTFMKSSASHPSGLHCRLVQKMVNCAPIAGAGGLTQFAQQFVSAVTAPPLVGCVVWSLSYHSYPLYVLFNHLDGSL